jgi:hypothetical protein
MSTPEEVSHYFGTIGRRVMVGGTYCLAAMLMFVTGWPLNHAVLTVAPRTVLWCVIFFFASAAACSAYLTVSEIFRNEIRTWNAGLTGGQARGDVAHIALNNHRTDSSADKLTRRRGRRRRAPSGDGRSR